MTEDPPLTNEVQRYLAIDMGAESARAIVGEFADGGLTLREIHRWPSRGETVAGTQYWDFPFIFGEIKRAMRKCARAHGPTLRSIGIDSWGVDFGLLDASGQLVQNPVQYRDHRTDGILDKAYAVLDQEAIYRETGIAFLQFNSLYQLWAMQKTTPEVLQEGKTFLMISDLLHYFLSGVARCEFTNASTTQLLDARTGRWSEKLFSAFGLPLDLMPEITQPGTVLGPLKKALTGETGIRSAQIVAPCTHDTGSAVLAVPGTGSDWAYISCGTWSCMGAELDEAITTDAALRYNFTNEGGYGRTIRFLKNIIGLWVLQQARASWATRGEHYEYDELADRARSADPFPVVLNIDDPIFLNPEDMIEAIATHCADTNQTPPGDVGSVARAILEGLALRYAITLAQLEQVTGRRFETIHMVGGGIQNELLCQFASNAMGRPVIAGPVEATALGNLVTQAIAIGDVPDKASARRLIADVTRLRVYEPEDHDAWNARRAALET